MLKERAETDSRDPCHKWQALGVFAKSQTSSGFDCAQDDTMGCMQKAIEQLKQRFTPMCHSERSTDDV